MTPTTLLFVADPLESFQTYKDSTFAMMREAASRGHALLACGPQDIRWERGSPVTAMVRDITLSGDAHDWFKAVARRDVALKDAGAVLMRKDPPFDSEFFYATHLLGQAVREGARVFNRPAGPARPPGKVGDPGVSAVHRADTGDARRRRDQGASMPTHQDIILKPLDGMGGMGIFRVKVPMASTWAPSPKP